MNPPPTRRHKALFVAGAVVLVLLGGFAACEWAGWPFLAQPVQRALSKTLQREVVLSDGQSHATVRFLGGLKVRVPRLQIGAPSWSRQPYFLQATNARMHLSYGDLWRAKKGAPLDIDLLQADTLVVHAERLADGRASWVFGGLQKAQPETDTRDKVFPTVRDLRVNEGQLTFVDAPLKADIVAELALAEGAAAAPPSTSSQPLPVALRGLIASAHGTYGPARLSANLRTAGVTPLLRSDTGAPAVPVVLELQANKASLTFHGTVTDVFRLSDLNGKFRVSGPSLAAVGDPLGVTLPTTGAFVLAGRVKKEGAVWNVLTDDATVGSSKLDAALRYDTRPRVPLLSGRVTGPRLLLADLAPAIGGEPGAAAAPPRAASAPASARVLPDKEFDLPSLRAMDANVLMAFDRVELGQLFALPLQPLKTHLTLQDGKLRLDDLVARTADGNLRGSVALDGTRDVALWRADLRWSGVKLENWLRQQRAKGSPPWVSGSLVGHARLEGQGRSTAQILGSLDGTVATTLRHGEISHLAVEAAGIDLAQALGVLVKGDEPLPVTCALADLKAQRGVLHPRALVVDTRDSTIWAEGQVSLKDEALDLKATVAPKDFSPLALRTPVHVKGHFKSPQVSVEKAPLARKLAGAVLLGLINPLAAIVPLIDKGDDGDGPDSCAQLLERARQASQGGAAAAAARKP
ncbi:MAG: AsmA family protein [Rhizobacter sp.]|nr:AsmA family protein [Rhizobacter sp.]